MSNELVLEHYPLKTDNPPYGWATVSVGQIAKLVASGFPSGEHNQDRRGVPHIRPMNIDREGRLDLTILKYVEGEIPRELQRGDVLFNNTNSPELIGKTTAVLIETRLAYSNHMTRIRLEDRLSPTFVARQLHFLWMSGYFRHRCVNHVNQASISADPLSETVPVLVAPSAEQSRIADALDELFSDLDAGVAALERVREKLKLYRASVLLNLVGASVGRSAIATEQVDGANLNQAVGIIRLVFSQISNRWIVTYVISYQGQDIFIQQRQTSLARTSILTTFARCPFLFHPSPNKKPSSKRSKTNFPSSTTLKPT